MSNSQKNLIELFKSGRVPGENSQPEHIQTVISNVFIFDRLVYKFYKNDNDFFNKGFKDLSGKSARFEFTKKDFSWNQSLSPSIYLKVTGVLARSGQIEFTKPSSSAEEIVIIMNRVNTADMLFEKIIRNQISESEAYQIGFQLGQTLKKVQTPLSGNYYGLFMDRLKDLRDWIKSVPESISIEESGTYCDFLESFADKNKGWFINELSREITVDGDFHSFNAILTNGKLFLMDTYPPKDDWGKGHPPIALYRMGVDVWALSGKRDLFEQVVSGYEHGSGIKIDRKLDDLYILYASGIAVSYLYMLSRTDPSKKEPAKKYHEFIREYFKKIK